MPERKDESLEMVHSETMDAIIGKPPAWIVRRGTLAIIGIIAMVFAGAWLIPYPDVMKGRVSIEATGQSYGAAAQLRYELAKKIKIGQQAIIRLRDYADDRFGYIAATVTGITDEQDSVAMVYMRLDKGLSTSTGKQIPPGKNLRGEVRIIGDKQTLLSRLFFRE